MPQVSASTTIEIDDWTAINDTVKRGQYRSMSHFIREAIKDKLKETE